ncbi:MAG: hypothetical protein IH571_04020 [Acholeplasmataceae bacterium]|nr:hypothetical protein [Acholeplasmataceae bacterium]
MDTIYTFLENMFSALPKTDAVFKAKDNLYQMMIEKYEDYKKEGKSENEAIGLVISEFGNIDELIEELGITRVEADYARSLTKEEVSHFIEMKSKHSARIGLGVSLIIIGASFAVSSDFISTWLGIESLHFMVGGMLLFLTIIVAVGLFILSGMELNIVNQWLQPSFDLSVQAKFELEKDVNEFQRTYQMGVLMGVTLILFAFVFFSLGSIFYDSLGYFFSFGLWMVALGVYKLVRVGIVYGAYNQLLKRGSYSPKMVKANKTTDLVASIVFPLAVIVYLLISFLTGRWDISWIIWPVVGISFGIFAGVIEEINKNKK